MLCFAEDDSVIGTAFCVMDCVEGRIMWDPSLPGMEPAAGAHGDLAEMNRVMAALHKKLITWLVVFNDRQARQLLHASD